MKTPTAAEVRARSELLTQRYPAADPPSEEPPALLSVIEDAAALVAGVTGRRIEPVTDGEEVPAGLRGIAVRAVARWAERVDTATQVGNAGKAAEGKRLRSISAGPWSESYFAPGELAMKNGVAAVTGDAVLDGYLWALMTDEKRDEWMAQATGVQPPAGAVSAFDYTRMGAGIGLRPGGPDGW